MTFLPRLFARRDFSLPPFDLRPLQLEITRPAEDDLALDRPAQSRDDGKVIALGRPFPTAGELRESIERHLSDTAGSGSIDAADPVDDLRNALAELRRSLR